MKALFGQFSFPGGVPSHCAPETPGSLHEGGELGYSLLHAYGAVLDNPDLVAFCVVGDGEAETGPLATSWHCNTFVDPVRDGAVLPILHLNGYKIANPTLLARIPEEQLLELMRGNGYDPHVVSGDDPAPVHQRMAEVMDTCLDDIARLQTEARAGDGTRRPEVADDRAAHPEGLDLPAGRRRPAGRGHLPRPPGAAARRPHQRRAPPRARGVDALLPAARAVRRQGHPVPELAGLSPRGDRRMSASPFANGGAPAAGPAAARLARLRRRRRRPGATAHEATRVLGGWLRDVTRLQPDNFLTFAPDELASNRLQDILEVTGRRWQAGVERVRRAPGPRGPGLRDALGARLPGAARGLPAHRPARGVHLLRGVHPHRRLDVQPAREVAPGERRRCRGADLSPASTTCCPRTSGGRTTTAPPTRTPGSSTW